MCRDGQGLPHVGKLVRQVAYERAPEEAGFLESAGHDGVRGRFCLLVVGIRAFPGTRSVNIQGDRGAVQ